MENTTDEWAWLEILGEPDPSLEKAIELARKNEVPQECDLI